MSVVGGTLELVLLVVGDRLSAPSGVVRAINGVVGIALFGINVNPARPSIVWLGMYYFVMLSG